ANQSMRHDAILVWPPVNIRSRSVVNLRSGVKQCAPLSRPAIETDQSAAQKKAGPWTSPRPRPLEQVCRLDQKGRCRLNTNLHHQSAQSNLCQTKERETPRGRDGTAEAFWCVG